MLSAANSLLVAGSGLENTMKMQHVRVKRAFNLDCARQEVGKVIEIPLSFATELRTAQKVEFVDAPKPEVEPVKAEPKPYKAAEPQKGAK